MRMSLRAAFAVAGLMVGSAFVATTAHAQAAKAAKPAQAAAASAAEGERLERQMWAYMKANDQANLAKMIAPGYQSAHSDGARDRAAELALIKGLNLGTYTLNRFQVTTSGDVMVVSYWVSVRETINGKTTSTKPALRQSVWQKTARGWQWIAHSNLVPNT